MSYRNKTVRFGFSALESKFYQFYRILYYYICVNRVFIGDDNLGTELAQPAISQYIIYER